MASLFSSRFTSAYTALRGDLGAPQSATDTIDKLVHRIQTGERVEDRRTAVLGLKGCTREYREEVGNRALSSLIAVLQHDAPFDPDIAKAVLETLMGLMEVGDKPARDDPALHFMDQFFESPEAFHSLLSILNTSPAFYPRFYTLQFLAQLLLHRGPVVQAYLIAAPPPGVESILSVLDPAPAAYTPAGGSTPVFGPDGRPLPQPAQLSSGASEMLRNEALLMLPSLLAGNADLQKIVAFGSAFEKLLGIIEREGGIEGGIVVQDVLVAIGGLLRFNVSNQNYFREISLIQLLPPMLYFPAPPLPIESPIPDDFTLQYWPEQKLVNAGLVLGLIRMLVGSPGGGNQRAMVASGVTRCLLELSLSSNAPSSLKSQALNALTPIMLTSPENQKLLSSLSLSPLVAVPADDEHPNGGFVRLPVRPASLALAASIIDGEGGAGEKSIRLRAAGATTFEAYVTGSENVKINILSNMFPSPEDYSSYPNEDAEKPQSAGSLLLAAIIDTPLPGRDFDPYRPFFACLLMSHLIRDSETAKKISRDIQIPTSSEDLDPETAVADDEESEPLLQLIIGNLLMAQREQAEAASRSAAESKMPGGLTVSPEEEGWNRVMIGYLVLLITWLWESPRSVRDFLRDESNLQVLIQPITQSNGVDALVQGLSAFLLGVCYEFNREPGDVTRSTLHPLLHSRIGPDQFVSRMARLRDDVRFKSVSPDQFDVQAQAPLDNGNAGGSAVPALAEGSDEENTVAMWFDWAFVDFWKNNYYTIQRSIAIEPDAVRGSLGELPDACTSRRLHTHFFAGHAIADEAEAAGVISSLRDKNKAQVAEIQNLLGKLSSQANDHDADRTKLVDEIQSLSEQLASVNADLIKKTTELESAHILAAETSQADEATHGAALDILRKDLEEASKSRGAVQAELDAALATSAEHSKALADTRSDLEVAKSQLAVLESEKLAFVESAKLADKPKAKDDDAALTALRAELDQLKESKADTEREHEDLLVLLEDLSQKRKKDKARMKENGLDVSDGEDEGEDEDAGGEYDDDDVE